jgi:hypothetical protein
MSLDTRIAFSRRHASIRAGSFSAFDALTFLQRAEIKISHYRLQGQGKSQLSGIFAHFTAIGTRCFP